MCVVCDLLELISLLVLALRPHRVANQNDCICAGVWSPELKHKSLDLENIPRRKHSPSSAAEQLPPVWTPNSSPTPDRKAYKPVRFESPTLSRKKTTADAKKVLTPTPTFQRSTDRVIRSNVAQVPPKPLNDLPALRPPPPSPPSHPFPSTTSKTRGKLLSHAFITNDSHAGT